jgi:hypothetical protein
MAGPSPPARVGERDYLMDLFEIIKTLGSFVGLLTGAVFFYDRFAKGRPIAYLSFKDDENKSAFLRIENPGTSGIAVFDIGVSPDVFGLAEDLERRNLLKAASGSPISFILAPGAGKELFVASKFQHGLPLELNANRITFRIFWRRGNSTWIPQIPVSVRTNMQTIRAFSLEKRRNSA